MCSHRWEGIGIWGWGQETHLNENLESAQSMIFMADSDTCISTSKPDDGWEIGGRDLSSPIFEPPPVNHRLK